MHLKNLSLIKTKISVLTFNQLQGKSRIFSNNLFLRILVFFLKSKFVLLITPKFVCGPFCNILISSKNYVVAKQYAKKAMEFPSSSTYATSMYLDIIREYIPENTEWLNMYDEAFEIFPWTDKYFAIRNWIFWNGTFAEKIEFLEKSLTKLNEKFDAKLVGKFRFLGEYSSNLGHHGCLFLYLAYRKLTNQANRINLVLDLNKSQNKYYLKLILDKFNIKPVDISVGNNIENEMYSTDSLFFGLDFTKMQYRVEADASHFTPGTSPEWNPPADYFLKLSTPEIDIGKEIFKDVLKNKWFVILHVKQNSSRALNSGQARDCDINDYSIFCKNIKNLGGIVIRMGDKRFPRVDEDLEIFDYPYSSLKSEFSDCWLWSQCSWWTGNVNGALMPPLTFGKPRLVTNQWHWALRGGKNDLISPKVLYLHDKIVPISDLIKSKVSATQNKLAFEKSGYHLKDNSPELLGNLAYEMYEKVILKSHINSNDSIRLTNLLKKELAIPEYEPCMSFANSFSAEFYSNLILL